MAAFRRKAATATTEGVAVHTTPASKTGLCIGLVLANISSQPEYADVDINGTYIVKNVPVPVGSTLAVLDGKMVVEANEIIRVTASANNAIDATISMLEL